MKGVLSCLLALVLVFSITPSVFAEEPVGGTTIYVDATNGDDTQEGVGTTSDKAYKTVAAAVAAAHRAIPSNWARVTIRYTRSTAQGIPKAKT